jgi:type IV pilus assembly protein PilW
MSRNKNARSRIRGVSLIELMIALAIGMLLVLGLVEVFSASRVAYQLSQGIARVQENGRFAMDYLQRDLRMVGHMGCVNDQARFLPENQSGTRLALASTFMADGDRLTKNYAGSAPNVVPRFLRFDVGIEAYEAVGTGTGANVALPAAPVVQGDVNAWSPALPNVLQGGANLNVDTANRVGNSDILVLRYFAPTGAQMKTFAPGDPTAVITVDSTQWDRLVEGVDSPALFGIADCMNAAVFEASATNKGAGTITVTKGGLNKSAMAGLESFVKGQATVYRAETVVYYVGLNDANVPALYRLRYQFTPGAGTATPRKEELVEGIESLQLQFGQDSRVDPSARPTGNIGPSNPANSLLVPTGDLANAWRRVGLVQVGLVARSVDSAAAAQRETGVGVTQLSALGVVMTPPADARYRSVYEESVALRNRLFGN